MSAAPFTKIQPRDGDTVMVCEHLSLDAAVPFERKEGTVRGDAHFFKTTGVSNFFVAVCDGCFAKYTPKELVQVAKYVVTWKGDAPVIREAKQ